MGETDGATAEQRRRAAAEEYLGVWAEHIKTSAFLKAATGILLLIAAAEGAAVWNLSGRTLKPLIVRVNDVGRAEAVEYEAMELSVGPLDPSTMYFIRQFLADHYGRRRQTVAERWPRSLMFLSAELAGAAQTRDTASVASWASGRQEVEHVIENIQLRVTPRPETPWEIVAVYDRVETSAGTELARTRMTTTLRYVFLDRAPLEIYRTNPIGLIIIYLESAEPID